MTKKISFFTYDWLLVALMTLASLVVLSGVYYFGSKSDLERARNEMVDTARYVNDEYQVCQTFNQVTVMLNLNRIIDKLHLVQRERDEAPIWNSQELHDYARDLRVTGLVVLDSKGNIISSSQKDGSLYKELYRKINKKSLLDVSSKVKETYAERLYMENDSVVDVAATKLPGTEYVLVAYYQTSSGYARDFNLSINRLLSGLKNYIGGKVVITDGRDIIANNDLTDENNRMYRDLIGQVKQYKINHGDIAEGELIPLRYDNQKYYALVSNGRNYFIYIFVPEGNVYTSRNIYLMAALIACVLFMSVVLYFRQRANAKVLAEQKRRDAIYEQNLMQKAQEADLANHAKTDFLRRMSHDIRTPINGIRGMVEIADHYPHDEEKQQEFRRKIWNASGYLLELVNEVLEINRLESGQLVLEQKPFNLNELFSDVRTLTEKQALVGHISIKQKIFDLKHHWFIGSPLHVKRLMMNIISNAIKYNKDYGTITLSLQEFAVDDTHSRILFTCQDTGYGMSDEFQKKMFEPFSQEDTGARTHFTGTGLGLSIVKKMVEAMDGTISCVSQLGQGTTFMISLPLELDSHGEEREIQTKEAVKDITGVRALLAEDNDLNMEIAQFFLENAGAMVDKATNGKEALEKFKASDIGYYDVVLMDVMMPVMDGLTATREIRHLIRSDAGTVPIIAMTANAFQEDRKRVLEAGMNEHLTKPLESEKLIATIGRYVK